MDPGERKGGGKRGCREMENLTSHSSRSTPLPRQEPESGQVPGGAAGRGWWWGVSYFLLLRWRKANW